MAAENNTDHSYRIAYAVGGIFLIGFILMTVTVVNDALHRTELEKVVPQAVVTATATPSSQ